MKVVVWVYVVGLVGIARGMCTARTCGFACGVHEGYRLTVSSLVSKSGGVNRAYAYADGAACAVAAAVLLLERWTDAWLGTGDWMSIYRGSYQHLHHIVLIEE